MTVDVGAVAAVGAGRPGAVGIEAVVPEVVHVVAGGVGPDLGRQRQAVVTIGGFACTPVTSQNHSKIVCTLGAGEGRNLAPAVTVNGNQPNQATTALFSYMGPVITDFFPKLNYTTAGGQNLTVRIALAH